MATLDSDFRAQPASATAMIDGAPSLSGRMSWGAVFAGAVIALAIGLMLNVLGAGVGAMMVNASSHSTPGASSFGIGAGLWLLISNLIALAIGAYAAARLSGTSDGTDGTLHGVAVWAATFLISAVLLGNLVAGVTSTAVSGASSVIGGLANGAGSLASAAGQQVANRASTGTIQSAAQSLVDRAQNALAGGGAPGTMTSDQRKAEIGQLITKRVTDGDLSQTDRDRLNALVAAEYNIAPADAQKRVQQVEQQTKDAVAEADQKARAAADATAKGAAMTSFAVFITMLLGIGAAIFGARRGTRDVRTMRTYNRLI